MREVQNTFSFVAFRPCVTWSTRRLYRGRGGPKVPRVSWLAGLGLELFVIVLDILVPLAPA